MKNKLLVIGLDGATWDILIPLIKKGKLKTFHTLVKNGSYGTLESCVPPVTGAAWLCLATGKNPGKTGVIDFLKRKDDSFKLYPVTSSDFKHHSFWDYLSKVEKKVGIFNYPMLSPPYKVNGFMVSGLSISSNGSISYPHSLKEELEKIGGKYEAYINYHNKKYNNIDIFLSDLSNYLNKFENWVYYIVKNKDWEMLFLVFSVTDWVQHIMWKYIDERHQMYDSKLSLKYKKKFVNFWKRIDNILGNILNIIPEDTIVFLVSDHGFGPNDQTFNLAKWLIKKRYLIRKRNMKIIAKKLLYKLLKLAAKKPIKKLFSSMYIEKTRKILKRSIVDEIDLKKSKAYCLGHTIPFGAIYINVDNAREREKVKSRLIHDLKNISKDVGKEVNIQIYECKKVYFGERINFLPDIIFTINNWRCVITENSFDGPLFQEKPFSLRHTGSHRQKGIFLAYGPGIRKGYKIENAKIYDIAPTILHIFGLPIPKDMDGRVLVEIFEPKSSFSKKPKYVDSNYYKEKKKNEKLEKIIQNLKSQGKI